MANLNSFNKKYNIKSGKFNTKPKNYTGKITQTIGSGTNAQYSLIYIVIIFSFIAIIVISILVILNYWLFRDTENKVPDITSDLKVIWEIVTPIITLALGYAFGKSSRE